MWHIYTMEYYAAIKNKDIIYFGGKWVDIENIILSEVSWSQKDTYVTDKWTLAIRNRIIMQQPTDQKKLSNKEGPREDL